MDVNEWNIFIFRLVNDLGEIVPIINVIPVFLAKYTVYFLAAIVLLLWFRKEDNDRRMIIGATLTLLVSIILGKLSGQFHFNEQPFAELPNVNKLMDKDVDNSFPSDHTILFFSYAVTFFLHKRGWSFLFVVLAFLVGVSRVWVGVLYPLDVLVSIGVSSPVAVAIYILMEKMKTTVNVSEGKNREKDISK